MPAHIGLALEMTATKAGQDAIAACGAAMIDIASLCLIATALPVCSLTCCVVVGSG